MSLKKLLQLEHIAYDLKTKQDEVGDLGDLHRQAGGSRNVICFVCDLHWSARCDTAALPRRISRGAGATQMTWRSLSFFGVVSRVLLMISM